MSGRLNQKPCPRCGCHISKEFLCGCGKVHEYYCDNCGRFVNFKDNEHIELGPTDAKCEKGPVQHEHGAREKADRIDAYFRSLQN